MVLLELVRQGFNLFLFCFAVTDQSSFCRHLFSSDVPLEFHRRRSLLSSRVLHGLGSLLSGAEAQVGSGLVARLAFLGRKLGEQQLAFQIFCLIRLLLASRSFTNRFDWVGVEAI